MTTTAVREKPMLFKAEMVQAILQRRKSQTRRILSPYNSHFGSAPLEFWEHADFDAAFVDGRSDTGQYLHVPAHKEDCGRCEEMGWAETAHRLYSRYEVGMHLWVKETWGIFDREQDTDHWRYAIAYRHNFPSDDVVWLEAPIGYRELEADERWRSPRFMPRWASRLTLEITGIRCEWLQRMSEEDAKAEGAERMHLDDLGQSWKSYKRGFQVLWDSINTKPGCSWEASPFVWVLEFRIAESKGRMET